MLKKLFLACAACLSFFGLGLQAQETTVGCFNSLSVGASVGTTGLGIDVATPIGSHLALRAGVTLMPGFSYSDEVDVLIPASSLGYVVGFGSLPGLGEVPSSMEVKGSMQRVAGEVILNFYPFKRSSFFLSGGAILGGGKLLKIEGHSDEVEKYMQYMTNSRAVKRLPCGIGVGNYVIPVDRNGNVSGSIKVASVRPYVGLGFGRIVPQNKRLGFLFELGVQFHGTPEACTDYSVIDHLQKEADNDFTEILNKVTVYPVMRFRLCGKIF